MALSEPTLLTAWTAPGPPAPIGEPAQILTFLSLTADLWEYKLNLETKGPEHMNIAFKP